ncbi:MAG: ATP-binding protein [Actinomycetota bacterium]|nr:ATP-binding protein [Actinomycetota bacterium]
MEVFSFPKVGAFVDRVPELDRLNEWWASPDPTLYAVYGRRRVGKSWLARRFAHQKRALVLVADQLSVPSQLSRFAAELEPLVGIKPAITSVGDLIEVIFRASRETKTLVVIDDFPWLLPQDRRPREEVLSEIVAVLERERDASRAKIVVTGSAMSMMESLFAEANPMHGRMSPMKVTPMRFVDAGSLLDGTTTEKMEKFAVAGGMPRYLELLGTGRLEMQVIRNVLSPNGPLWDEPRILVGHEFDRPNTYMSLIEAIGSRGRSTSDIARDLSLASAAIMPYLNALVERGIVRRVRPYGASSKERNVRWEIADPFFRFWGRFILPYQADLEVDTEPAIHYDRIIKPHLADHTAPVFEDQLQRYVRSTLGLVADRWWGHSLHDLRRTKERLTEEVDLVAGPTRREVTVVGEAKWTRRKLGFDVLQALRGYKIPALRQSGLHVSAHPAIFLAAKSGFTNAVVSAADEDDTITLLDVGDLPHP